MLIKTNAIVKCHHLVQQNAMALPQEGTQFVTNGKNDVILLKTVTIVFIYLRLY